MPAPTCGVVLFASFVGGEVQDTLEASLYALRRLGAGVPDRSQNAQHVPGGDRVDRGRADGRARIGLQRRDPLPLIFGIRPSAAMRPNLLRCRARERRRRDPLAFAVRDRIYPLASELAGFPRRGTRFCKRKRRGMSPGPSRAACRSRSPAGTISASGSETRRTRVRRRRCTSRVVMPSTAGR
jgi:hypothetical protein